MPERLPMTDPLSHISEGGKHALDILSVGTLLGTLFQFLPGIAALLTIVWTAIRIIETDTVRGIIAKIRNKPAD